MKALSYPLPHTQSTYQHALSPICVPIPIVPYFCTIFAKPPSGFLLAPFTFPVFPLCLRAWIAGVECNFRKLRHCCPKWPRCTFVCFLFIKHTVLLVDLPMVLQSLDFVPFILFFLRTICSNSNPNLRAAPFA